jgi:hypothetical protein
MIFSGDSISGVNVSRTVHRRIWNWRKFAIGPKKMVGYNIRMDVADRLSPDYLP